MVASYVQTWVPGSTIGQYLLVRELARGGMGEIWLARQTSASGFDRLVALKRVIAGPGADPNAMTMFLDEARIASQLQHPNIVQVFDLGNDEGSAFLVMEYLTGLTLNSVTRKLIETQGGVSPHLAVEIVSSAARGLGYAHRRTDLQGHKLDIVHRDVSPQNVFVTWEGEVKVLDFGIARAAGRMGTRTMIGVIKGKVSYMSPEQASGGELPVTGAADVYALGIILFELVTGSRFYKVKDDLAILQRLSLASPAPKPSSRGVVDPALEELILKALEPDATHRYADGQELHEALEAWRRTHPASRDTLDLRGTMAAHFSKERDALLDLQREAALTPRPSSPRAPPPPVGAPATAQVNRNQSTMARVEGPRPSAPNDRSARPTMLSRQLPESGVKTILAAAADEPEPKTIRAASPIDASPTVRSAPLTKRSSLPSAALALGAVGLVGAAALAWWALRAPPEVQPAVVAPTPRVAAVAVDAGLRVVQEVLVDAGVPEVAVVIDAGPALAPVVEAEPALNVPPPPPTRPAVARPAEQTGRLSLDTDPWTTVFLGKRALGDTPLLELTLPVGRHRLRLVNPNENLDSVVEVVIKPNETTTKRLAF